MTTPSKIVTFIKTTIEKSPGFKGNVHEMGYNILDAGGWEKAVIIRSEGADEAEQLTYGDSYYRKWVWKLEVYSHLDQPEACHNRLMKAIGDITTIFEQYEFLAKGAASAFYDVAIVSISPAEEEILEEGAIVALRSDILLRTYEEVSTPTKEV